MGDVKCVKKILIFLSLTAFLCPVNAFSGSGGAYDFNAGTLSDRSEATVSGGNYAGDFVLNESGTGTWGNAGFLLRTGLYFDQNKPTVTITTPTAGSTSTSSSVTLTYTSVSLGNPIKHYLVQVDSEGWINNGINLSKEFINLANGSHTFYVIAVDAYDLNADQATVTFSINTATSTTTITSAASVNSESGASPGGGKKNAESLTAAQADNPVEIIKKTNYQGITATTSDGIEFSRNVSFQTIKTQNANRTNLWRFDIAVKNTTSKNLKNTVIREKIPKEVAKHVSKITFREEPSAVINPDPEVEWFVEELNSGEEKSFMYFVGMLDDKKRAGDLNAFFANMPAAVITTEEKKEAPVCQNVDCDDDNLCTIDACTDLGACTHSPRDGLRCDEGKVCRAGSCIATEQKPSEDQLIPPPIQKGVSKESGMDALIAGIAAILTIPVIIVVAIIAFLIYKSSRK